MIDLPNITRLFLVLFLLSIWFARRDDRTPLCWAIAYFALAAGSYFFTRGLAAGDRAYLQLAALFPGVYAGMFWAGTRYFGGRPPSRAAVSVLVVSLGIAVSVAMAVDPVASSYVAGIAIAGATCWGAVNIGARSPKYWPVAGVLVAQALILLLAYFGLWGGIVMQASLSAGYAALAIGLVYVVLKESNETISRQATRDPLTGLPNRAVLVDRLNTIARSASVAGFSCAVVIVDIDQLKRINQAFGRTEGDRVLKDVAARLAEVASSELTLARYGGDEFVFLVSGVSADDVVDHSEDLSARIAAAMQAPFLVNGVESPIGASIGIAVWGPDGTSAEAILEHAKQATAKERSARKAWAFFNAAENDRAQREIAIERRMLHAMRSGEMAVHYQPIARAGTLTLAKAEALARWTHPELGEIAPAEFVRIAEESQLIHDLGAWVLEEACRAMVAWGPSLPAGFVMCVNVSAIELRREGFAAGVAATLLRHGLAPGMLELECTESILMDDDAVVLAAMREIRALGIGLSLDDFGTGYSSLSYLTRFDFSTLKIDRAFVHQLEHDAKSRKLAESICAIGKSLNMALVAEGVETPFEVKTLTRFGVDFIQGFYIGVPAPADEFLSAAPLTPRPRVG